MIKGWKERRAERDARERLRVTESGKRRGNRSAANQGVADAAVGIGPLWGAINPLGKTDDDGSMSGPADPGGT